MHYILSSCKDPYLVTVTVEIYGEPKTPQNRILVLNIVNRTSYPKPGPKFSFWAKHECHNVKLSVGTFQNVAVYTIWLTMVNMGIRHL